MEVGRTGGSRSLAFALALASLFAAGGNAAPARDAGSGVPFSVATHVPRPASAAGASERRPSVTMSEGWACAAFESERGRIHQCWDASPTPRAFPVPWMKDRIYVARDRWCEHDVHGSTFRCWQRPRRGDTAAREMPASWQWSNPHNAGWDDVYNRGDRLEDVIMGGTFACLRTTQAQGVFCLGDDHFGQLGGSAPPRPQAGAGDPAFVRDVGGEVKPALGTWHACALAAPRTLRGELPVICWGRGDQGQLGAPAPDKCTVDGKSVACARTPVRGPRVKDQMAVLGAGDLFTCVTAVDGTRCWGASRDGLFGVPGSCPQSLRRAWPTADGPVPAPKASCTTTPIALPGATEFDPYFQVAPRRICYGAGGKRRCLSGVPQPRDPNIGHTVISPGSDASACAVRGDGVVCWGEKYSPPGTPDQPVPVVFEPLPPLGDQAIIDGRDAATAKARCQNQSQCTAPVKKLATCEGDNDPGWPVAEILAKANSLSGGIVRARGGLGVGALEPFSNALGVEMQPKVPCDPAVSCCKRGWAPVLVGGAGGALALEGMSCEGDESRACCNAPAYGQTVIATGRLLREQLEQTMRVGWRLVNVSVCEVAPATPAAP